MIVLPSMPLTTLDEVLAHEAVADLRKMLDDGRLDLLTRENIQQRILAASHDLETSCGRKFLSKEWTQVCDLDGRDVALYLDAYPVASIVTVKFHATGDFDAATAMAATSYTLRRHGRLGELVFRDTAGLEPGYGVLQVVYRGGLAPMIHHLPADLRLAAAEQVVFSTKRGEAIEVSSLTQDQGSVTYYRNGSGTPGFSRAVYRYRERIL